MSVLLSVCHLDQFVVKRFCLIFFLHQLQTLIANWSVFVRIFFGQVDDTAFYESKVSIWRSKNVLPNLCLFHLSFADLEQKNQGFFRKTIGSVVKMAYHVSKEIFCREFFFSKKFFFYFSIGHWANFFCQFDGNLSAPLSLLFSVCQMDQFVVKTLLSKNFFPNIFGHWSQNDQSLFDFFSARLTTLHSTGARDQFEELRPFWKTLVCFIYHLRTLSQKIKAFFRKTIDRFVKIAHHVSKWIFCREFFSKKFFFYLIIGHWATFVCHFDENLSVPLSVLLSVCHLDQFVVKKSLSNFFFSISYGHVSQNYWSLLKFFSAKLTTLLSTSPKDQFEVKHLLWKVFVCFLSFSNIEREINGFFVGKQIAVLSKLLTTCQGDLLKIFLFWKSSFFAHHWSLIDFISGISTNNSLLCPQNCFLSVHCNILW